MENPNREYVTFTPLGKGKVVYEFPSGRVAVELENGDGHIFFREQVAIPQPSLPKLRRNDRELSNAG